MMMHRAGHEGVDADERDRVIAGDGRLPLRDPPVVAVNVEGQAFIVRVAMDPRCTHDRRHGKTDRGRVAAVDIVGPQTGFLARTGRAGATAARIAVTLHRLRGLAGVRVVAEHVVRQSEWIVFRMVVHNFFSQNVKLESNYFMGNIVIPERYFYFKTGNRPRQPSH